MAYKYIGKDIYKQLEQVIIKLDETLLLNKELNEKITELNKIIVELKEENNKLSNEIDRLKNKNNKNSSNSSKPSSTDIIGNKPNKKTGANLYNYRIKTNNKIGGQFGHEGHNLSKEKIEKLIKENKVEVRTIEHYINGSKRKKETIKYRIGIEIKSYVEKHIFKYDENVTEVLPKEYQTDVTYDNSIKALCIELGVHNVMPIKRLSIFLSTITNNVVNLSQGNIVNIQKEFSNKSKVSLNVMEEDILNDKVNYTDETVAKYNGSNMYIRNYSNKHTVIYKAHKNKGHKPILEDNILTRFCGGIMGDHDTTLYSYGKDNYECNIHSGRYLEELIQNTSVTWVKDMKDFLFRVNNTRKIAKQYGLDSFDTEKIEEYKNEYINILEIAKEENKSIDSSFYKERAEQLRRRLLKYKDNHLGFIEDFNIPFDNNLSEQDLRVFKIKTKISGGFRSMESAQYYANSLSIVKTSIKRDINTLDSIMNVLNNKIAFQ